MIISKTVVLIFTQAVLETNYEHLWKDSDFLNLPQSQILSIQVQEFQMRIPGDLPTSCIQSLWGAGEGDTSKLKKKSKQTNKGDIQIVEFKCQLSMS